MLKHWHRNLGLMVILAAENHRKDCHFRLWYGEAYPEWRMYGLVRVILKQRKRLFGPLRVYEAANKGLERWGCGMSYRLLVGRKKRLLM